LVNRQSPDQATVRPKKRLVGLCVIRLRDALGICSAFFPEEHQAMLDRAK